MKKRKKKIDYTDWFEIGDFIKDGFCGYGFVVSKGKLKRHKNLKKQILKARKYILIRYVDPPHFARAFADNWRTGEIEVLSRQSNE